MSKWVEQNLKIIECVIKMRANLSSIFIRCKYKRKDLESD